jgi:RNA polymerase sigma-70 factor (ECF subfamily)
MYAGAQIRGGAATSLDDERAREFASFVAEHRERAVGLAYRLVGGDLHAAEDVAQEAFVRAHKGLARFRGDASLSTWFYRILVNEANRYHRLAWIRKRSADEPADAEDPSAGAQPDPVLRARIARALSRLPRGQRESFVLVHLEGFTVAETSAITGRATGTIKSHLHRATHTLRARLADLAPCAIEPRAKALAERVG